MQTDELKRAQNREKQRIWREKNLERSRELKRIANWKVRGTPKPKAVKVSQEKKPKKVKPLKPLKKRKSPPIESAHWLEEPKQDIEVSLCMGCYRKYLSKYQCMWCNGEIKEIYYARTSRTAEETR